MANNRIVVAVIMLLCCSVVLTGCKDTEKEKALEEVSNLKAQLTKVEADLTQITSERDDLKAVADKVITLEEKTAKLLRERDHALDKAAGADVLLKQLKSQLAQQVQKALALQEQNKTLQDTISKHTEIADATEAGNK